MKKIYTTFAACLLLSVGFGQSNPCSTGITADYTYELDPTIGGIIFTDNTQIAVNETFTSAWNFGNGKTSTDTNPVIMFDEGTYQVTLVVTDLSGCQNTIQKDVEFTYGGQ